MHEKRSSKRTNMDLAVECQLVKRNFITPLTGLIKVKASDISSGGVRLKWPSGWNCSTCDKCAGWIFNRDCHLKVEMDEPLNRNLNVGLRIKMRFLKKSLKNREYCAKIIWTSPTAKIKSGYDTGLSFMDADRVLERELSL